MKKLIVLMIALAGAQAQADGFRCYSQDRTLNVQVFNHVDANKGTRTAATMVLSDPRVQTGNRTIAKFESATGLLSSTELIYTAKVDLRYVDSRRKGEYIAGTRLGEIDTLDLYLGFSYGTGLEDGDWVPANLIVTKRNGQEVLMTMGCERYIKN